MTDRRRLRHPQASRGAVMIEMAIQCIAVLSVIGGIVFFRDHLANKYCHIAGKTTDNDLRITKWDSTAKQCVVVDEVDCPEGFAC